MCFVCVHSVTSATAIVSMNANWKRYSRFGEAIVGIVWVLLLNFPLDMAMIEYVALICFSHVNCTYKFVADGEKVLRQSGSALQVHQLSPRQFLSISYTFIRIIHIWKTGQNTYILARLDDRMYDVCSMPYHRLAQQKPRHSNKPIWQEIECIRWRQCIYKKKFYKRMKWRLLPITMYTHMFE